MSSSVIGRREGQKKGQKKNKRTYVGDQTKRTGEITSKQKTKYTSDTKFAQTPKEKKRTLKKGGAALFPNWYAVKSDKERPFCRK